MTNSAFLTIEFWALVIISFALPCIIFFRFIHKRKRRHAHILSFALLLILLAGADVLLLHQLEIIARETGSLMDDAIFVSGYLLAARHQGAHHHRRVRKRELSNAKKNQAAGVSARAAIGARPVRRVRAACHAACIRISQGCDLDVRRRRHVGRARQCAAKNADVEN